MKEKELNRLYEMEKNDPEQWKVIYPALSRDELKEYIKFKSSRKVPNRHPSEAEMTSPIDRTMKWASSRWNEGNFDILYEMRTRLKLYHAYTEGAINHSSGLSAHYLHTVQRMKRHFGIVIVSSDSLPFSNFYRCSFKAEDGMEYHSIVQYMAAYKARLFEDKDSLMKIMSSNDPHYCYQLGLNVVSFDRDYWRSMFSGNHLVSAIKWKFSQSEELMAMLLNTDSKIFAFAGADRDWCTGLDQSSIIGVPVRKWPGLNAMGELLSEIRDQLA